MLDRSLRFFLEKLDSVRKRNLADAKNIDRAYIAADDGESLGVHGKLGHILRYPKRFLREHGFIRYDKSFTRKRDISKN